MKLWVFAAAIVLTGGVAESRQAAETALNGDVKGILASGRETAKETSNVAAAQLEPPKKEAPDAAAFKDFAKKLGKKTCKLEGDIWNRQVRRDGEYLVFENSMPPSTGQNGEEVHISVNLGTGEAAGRTHYMLEEGNAVAGFKKMDADKAAKAASKLMRFWSRAESPVCQ